MHHHEASSVQTHGLDLGDYIGMESCVDLETDVDTEVCSQRCGGGGGKSDHRWGMKRVKKEKVYPMPIPWLARTENLPPLMPRVLKRYYTSDGRLVIKEVKVSHHEYFRAHRADGRLTLQLVPLDDDNDDNDDDGPNTYDVVVNGKYENVDEPAADGEETGCNEDNDDRCSGGVTDSGNDNIIDVGLEEVTMKLPELYMETGTAVVGGGGGGGGGKYFKYNSVRSTSCMFGMPVPTIRPVHI